MKKKIALVLLSAILVIGIAAGCTDKEDELAALKADEKQNTVDVIGIGEIEDELGVAILVPASVTDETCQVADGNVGIIRFTSGDADYVYYVQAGETASDATGTAAALPNRGTFLVDNATYEMAYEDGGAGVAWWYDKTNQVSCTLFLESTQDPTLLRATAESFIAVQN